MRLPVDGIQAFVQIARLGSFHRAAEMLFITQTALSRRIQRLEAFVGARLLDRTTRTTTLTPIGREFLPFATRSIDDLTYRLERLQAVARLSLGEVSVAALQSVAFQHLPLVLSAYARSYPYNRVHVLERSGALVTEAVRQGLVDFGIHVHQDEQPDLEEEPLMRDSFVLVCKRDDRLALAEKIAWAELGGVDLITLGGASGNRSLTEEQLVKHGLELRKRFVVESTPSAIALVRADIGAAAILPAAAVSEDLIGVPLVDPVIYRSICLVRRVNESLSPAAEALYRVAKAKLSVPANPEPQSGAVRG